MAEASEEAVVHNVVVATGSNSNVHKAREAATEGLVAVEEEDTRAEEDAEVMEEAVEATTVVAAAAVEVAVVTTEDAVLIAADVKDRKCRRFALLRSFRLSM